VQSEPLKINDLPFVYIKLTYIYELCEKVAKLDENIYETIKRD
jgi:hypothetical protein